MSAAASAPLESLRRLNPALRIVHARSAEFAEFGRVLEKCPTAGLVDWMSANVPIGDGVSYQRSVTNLEDLARPDGRTWRQWASACFFGGAGAQAGWVAGRNTSLGAFEYHKSSELLVAATPLLLFLGRLSELENFERFDVAQVVGVVVDRGVALELYATSLHLSPLMVDRGGFRAAIILPAGTNAPLEGADASLPGEEGLLRGERKWLLACAGSRQEKLGARVGMENLELILD